MNHRVSKREMKLRLEELDPIHRVHVDEVRTKSALVTVDGFTCNFRFPKQARSEMLQQQGVFGYVSDIPSAIGDGLLKHGTRSEDLRRSLYRAGASRPAFKVFDRYTLDREHAFLAFQEAHPIGTIVSGRVRFYSNNRVVMNLGLGMSATMSGGDCLDHVPGERVKWLGFPPLGAIVDVLVRGYYQRRRQVTVSLHSFVKDDRYCSYAAGYRGNFNYENACFKKLPWENKPC